MPTEGRTAGRAPVTESAADERLRQDTVTLAVTLAAALVERGRPEYPRSRNPAAPGHLDLTAVRPRPPAPQ